MFDDSRFLLWEQVVAGSNPATPILEIRRFKGSFIGALVAFRARVWTRTMDISLQDLVHRERCAGHPGDGGGHVPLGRCQVGVTQSCLSGRRIPRSLGGPRGMAVAQVTKGDRWKPDRFCGSDEGSVVHARQKGFIPASLLPSRLEDLEYPRCQPEYSFRSRLGGLGGDPQDGRDAGALGSRFDPSPGQSTDLLGAETRPDDYLRLGPGPLRARVPLKHLEPSQELLIVVQVTSLVCSRRVGTDGRNLGQFGQPSPSAGDPESPHKSLDLLPDGLASRARTPAGCDVGLQGVEGHCFRIGLRSEHIHDVSPTGLDRLLLALPYPARGGSFGVESAELGEVVSFPPPRATSRGEDGLSEAERRCLSRIAVSFASADPVALPPDAEVGPPDGGAGLLVEGDGCTVGLGGHSEVSRERSQASSEERK